MYILNKNIINFYIIFINYDLFGSLLKITKCSLYICRCHLTASKSDEKGVRRFV